MMSTLIEQPPTEVRAELLALNESLNETIPAKRPGENLLIATWNIRAFGSLTRKWTAGANDSPKRDLRALRAIVEILSRFDVVAIQEVVGNLRALRDTLHFLGPDWSFLMTDVTEGAAGNNERMAFLFDRRRVHASGLACEIVVPPEWLVEVAPTALNRQFARTPYAVSFRVGGTTVILVTLHVLYGDAPDRIPELTAIARWMKDWANRTNRWGQNLIALGDFNIDRRGDVLWQAFTSTGLVVPDSLNRAKRTVFSDPERPDLDKFYDQIAWFASGRRRSRLNIPLISAGSFDFLPHVYRDSGLSKRSISYRISDHYPLWTEFGLGE